MENEYFETGSTGSKDYFEDEKEDAEELMKEEELKDFEISTERYKKVEVKLKTIKYEIKD